MRICIATIALLLSACATGPLEFNPYGLPYTDANTLKNFTIDKGCKPKDLDEPPVLRFGSVPLYPAEEGLNGHPGRIRVVIDVDADGQFRVLESTFKNQYTSGHLSGVGVDWKLEPARRGSVPVAVTCTLVFGYGQD